MQVPIGKKHSPAFSQSFHSHGCMSLEESLATVEHTPDVTDISFDLALVVARQNTLSWLYGCQSAWFARIESPNTLERFTRTDLGDPAAS